MRLHPFGPLQYHLPPLWSAKFWLAVGLLAVMVLAVVLHRIQSRRRPVILIDGSNVMHWRDGTPSLAPLRAVIGVVRAAGFELGIVFDANAGYKLFGRYLDDADLARKLDLPADQVLVVPKGQPADPVLLAIARDRGASIITNDRYRDWAETHPEIATPGHLIRGGWRDDEIWLDLAASGSAKTAASRR